MDRPMRQAARAAVERGFDFLERTVGSDANALGSDGGWPFWRYATTELTGDREIEYPPLVAGLGLLALDACHHPRAGALVARTRDFLRHWIRYPGVWSYQRDMTPNFDDTSINGLAVGPHPWLRMGRLRGLNFDVFLSNRDGSGRFVTWTQGEDWPPGLDNIFDVVVNANVLAYMGDHPETQAARHWIETLFVDRRETEGLVYYPEPFDLHFAMARATCFRDGIFSELRPTLVRRILERFDADDGFSDSMRTAQALSALDMLAFDLDEAVRSEVLGRLLEVQGPDGSWPPCLVWNEPTGWAIWAAARGQQYHVSSSWGFASEVLTTAFCIEGDGAVARVLHFRTVVGRRLMDDRVREAARSAVGRGLDFLESVVAPNGAWPSWRYDNTELVGDRHLEYPAFTAALGVLALGGCRHVRAGALVARMRDFIGSCMQYPGIWSYPTLPPGFDDTAVCALAMGPHPWLRMGRLWGLNFDVFLSNRDGSGRFVTWTQGEDWPPKLENEVDAVVNANVLAYMGDHPETQAAQRWVETVVADRREANASPYYVEPVDLHFAMARATCFRDGIFSGLRPTLVSRILERLDSDEGFGDPMRAAQALSALDMLAFDLDRSARSTVVETLLEAQRGDGSWPPCLAWKEPPGWADYLAANEDPQHARPARGFASETITTAFCIEAMGRSLASS